MKTFCITISEAMCMLFLIRFSSLSQAPVYNIKEYGDKEDGKALDTQAIKSFNFSIVLNGMIPK